MHENKCDGCQFHNFMLNFGIKLQEDNCWIDCTNEIKDELDYCFDVINDHILTNESGLVLFDGNTDQDYKSFIEENNLSSGNCSKTVEVCNKWRNLT